MDDDNSINETDQDQPMTSSDDEPELIIIDEDVYSSAEEEEVEAKCGNFLEHKNNPDENVSSNEIKVFEPELIVINDDERSINTELVAYSSQSEMLDKKNNDSAIVSAAESLGESLQFKVKEEKDSDKICKIEVGGSKKNKDELDLIVIDDEGESSTTCDAISDENFKDSDMKNDIKSETLSAECQTVSHTKGKTVSLTEVFTVSDIEGVMVSDTECEKVSDTEDKIVFTVLDSTVSSAEDRSWSSTEGRPGFSAEGRVGPSTESSTESKIENNSKSPTEDESAPPTKDKCMSIFKNEAMSPIDSKFLSSIKNKSACPTKDESTSLTKDKPVCTIKEESISSTKDKTICLVTDEALSLIENTTANLSESKPISTKGETSNTKCNKKLFNGKQPVLLIEEDTMSDIEAEKTLPTKNKISSPIKNIMSCTEDKAVSLTVDDLLSAVDKAMLSSEKNILFSNEGHSEFFSKNMALFRSASKILPLGEDNALSFSKEEAVLSNKGLKIPSSKAEHTLKSIADEKGQSSIVSKVQSIEKSITADEKDGNDRANMSLDTGNVMVEQEDLSNILECQLEVGTPNVEWAQKVQNWQKQLQQPVPSFTTESRLEIIHKIPEGKIKLTKKGFFDIKVLFYGPKKSFSFRHASGPNLMKRLKTENFLIDPVKWLILKGMATGNTDCPMCLCRNLKEVKTTVYTDGYAWCCLNSQCKRYHPFIRPPFFNKYDYSLSSLLAAVYHWAFQSHCNHLMEDTGLTIDSLMNLYQTLQLLCSVFTDNFDRNSKRVVKPYDIVETSVFKFGSSLILAVYERNTKLIRLQALPCDESQFLVTLSKFAEFFIDRNHLVVSDCSLIEQLKIPCMGFAYANSNITNEDNVGWHCLNVISFVKLHVQGIFEKFEANSASLDVWQGFLNEVEWRQRYGLINEIAFWSMICCVAKKPTNQNKACARKSCIQMKVTSESHPKQAINKIVDLNNPEVKNDLCKDNLSNKNNTSVEIAAIEKAVTSTGWDILKSATSSERSILKTNFVESYGISTKTPSQSDVISSVMFQPDGLDAVTVTALLSIRTWPLVSYLQNLIKASREPIDYNVSDWRTKLEKEEFFSHPLKWLVGHKLAPENYSCNECKSEVVHYGDSEQLFLICGNKSCRHVQPLKRPKFFSKFGFPMKDLLCLLYHWAAQLPFQTICESVPLNEYKVRYVFWGVQKHCSAILQQNPKLGNENHAIEVGIIQYGEFCILGALNRQTKETRLRAMYAPMLYKSTLFEPVLNEWLCKESTIFTCHNPFSLSDYKVIYVADNEDVHFNAKTITLYLKSIVSALFSQYSTIGIKVDIIQSFLDEIQWRQKYGCTPEVAFMSLLDQFTRDDELGYEQLIPQLTSTPSTNVSTQIWSKKALLINDKISTSEDPKSCPIILNTPFCKEKVQISNPSSFNEDNMDITSNASSSLSFNINQITVPETSSMFRYVQCSTIPEKDKKTTNRKRETSRKRASSGHRTYSRCHKRPNADYKLNDRNNSDEMRRNKIPKLNNKNEIRIISALSTEQNASDGVLISKYSRDDFLKKAKSIDFLFKDYFQKLPSEASEIRSNCLWSLEKRGGKLLRPVLTDSLSFLQNPRAKKSIQEDDDKSYVPLDEYYFAEIKPNLLPSSDSVSYVYNCIYCKIYLFGNIEVIDHSLKHIADRRENMNPKIFSCPFFIHRYISSAYCLFAFSSKGEQTHHLKDVHLETNSLSCLICSLPFCSSTELYKHMKNLHVPCEMPYTCPVCTYRSSLHKEVLEHFQLIHKNDPHLICPYCLKMCSPTHNDDPVLFTNAYNKHLFKHQEINENVQCPSCCLLFFTYDDLYSHAVKDHVSFLNSSDAVSFKPRCHPTVVLAKIIHPVPAPASHPAAVFANSKILELVQLKNNQLLQARKVTEEELQSEKKKEPIMETELPCVNPMPTDDSDYPPLEPIPTLHCDPIQSVKTDQGWQGFKYHINRMLWCIECGNQADSKHFFKLLNCYCNYTTFCAKAFVLHMMQKHYTMEEVVHTLSATSVKLSDKSFCSCLFSSDDPDVLASHLKVCSGFINISNTDFTKTCQKKDQRLYQMFKQLGAVSLQPNQEQLLSMKTKDTSNLTAIDNSSRNPSSPPLENLPMSFVNRPLTYTNEQMGNMPPPNSFQMLGWQSIPPYLNNVPTTATHTLTNSVTHPYSAGRLIEAMCPPPNIQPHLIPQFPGNNLTVREALNVPIPHPNGSIRAPPPAYGNPNSRQSIVPPKSNSRIKAGVMSVRNGVAYIQEVPISMAGRYPSQVPFQGQSPSATLQHGLRPNILRCLLRDNWMIPKDVMTGAVITPRCSLQQQQTKPSHQTQQDHQQVQLQQQQQPPMLPNLVTAIKQEKPD